MILKYIPDGSLVIGLLIMCALDFVFGVTKATLTKTIRTSKGFRKTFTKFTQYGGAIVMGIVLLNIKSVSDSRFGSEYSSLFGDSMISIMIYIEVVSILENMEVIGKDTDFVKYFIRPVRRLITFQVKNLFSDTGNIITK
ncbi:phage holin family protein [Flavobacterium piscisymbiosum]|uniref:Phage holin family protein n=1 Tax=Flavobacterium piscisymbiosum TaxID=2893753 RepID=A0ABS8MLA7_9FLAO|nr:phage holin family protein [Flavobacterium sp. F-30]MCC9066276.1 phage holin family protein [Flavobacterium sp. F-30]